MLITSGGKILRLRVADIRVVSRNTQGVQLIQMDKEEKLVSVARLAEPDEAPVEE